MVIHRSFTPAPCTFLRRVHISSVALPAPFNIVSRGTFFLFYISAREAAMAGRRAYNLKSYLNRFARISLMGPLLPHAAAWLSRG